MKIVLALMLAAVAVFGVVPTVSSASGKELWQAHYAGSGDSFDRAQSVVASPDGTAIYVTGRRGGASSGEDYSTLGYDAATGGQLWEARYNGEANGSDSAVGIAIAPDGRRVYVTGVSAGLAGDQFVTLAYDAGSGGQIWEAHYQGAGDATHHPSFLAVSPDGATLYVAGFSYGAGDSYDYVTVAYDAASGARLWADVYDGPGGSYDFATSIAVSPDSSRVYVTGASHGSTTGADYGTLAYEASSGARLWVARYHSAPDGHEIGRSVAVSPDGKSVYVTGYGWSDGPAWEKDGMTVAYEASSGSELWAAHHQGPVAGPDYLGAIAVNPSGDALYVTGKTRAASGAESYLTVGYRTSNGEQLWVALYSESGGGSEATSLAVSPDGQRLYVTGDDFATVAYHAGGGEQIWAARYDGLGGSYDKAYALALSPDGTRLFVAGATADSHSSSYLTVAYDTAGCGDGRYQDGPLSSPVHDVIEPSSAEAGPAVRGVNCSVVARIGG